jgi:hypothetical protein
MRLRLGIAAAVLILGIGAIVALISLTGGDEEGGAAGGTALSWEDPPTLLSPADLPDDRIAYGTVRNTSLERIQAANGDFVVRDASGAKLDASVQFLAQYAHGLYGAFQKPNPLPDEERSRLGFTVDLQTGQTAPLTVSYRLTKDSDLPATLYYKGVPALKIPSDG